MRYRLFDVIFVLAFGAVSAYLASKVVYDRTQDTILYVMVIPIFFASFFRPKWMFLTLMALLAAASAGEVLLISNTPFNSFLVIIISAAIAYLGCEILHALGQERRRAEQALKASEERYHSLVENLPLGVYRNTPEPGGRFIMANKATMQIHGYASAEKFLETPVASLYINPSDRQRLSDKLVALGKITAEEVLLKRNDESPLWASITATAIKDASGNVKYFDGIIEDITQRRMAERTIIEQRMKMIASSRLSSLGVMARGVAHEINNPLAIISVGLEQLHEICSTEEKPYERGKAVVATIARNVDRIQRIVRGLRNLSRDTDHEPLGTRSIKELLDDALSLCRGRFRNNHIDLIEDDIPADLSIECRPVQISQAVMNLLCNAEEAVEQVPTKWIHVTCKDNGDHVELCIADSGHGVPDEFRDRIFEPFFSTKAIGKGTGLGLSVARGLVESHHGELLLLEDMPNTRFNILLPKKQPSSQFGVTNGAAVDDSD